MKTSHTNLKQKQAVLPKEARQKAQEIRSNPEQAKKFLVRAGIITSSKKLTANYR